MTGLNAPHWLIARPIAHRGLHDARTGIVENTLAAAERAIAGGMAIECDVQLSADGEAMVFHDATLDRLTNASGPLAAKRARDIESARFKASDERIPSFQAFLERVAGRTPVICEIKSEFDDDFRLAERVANLASAYDGPLALKSFDPSIIEYFRRADPSPGPRGRPCPLGIVAQARYDGEEWGAWSPARRTSAAHFLHYPETRPDFLSYCVDDLPNAVPFLLRTLKATPVMAWTVRVEAQRRLAAKWADQIVFEGEFD